MQFLAIAVLLASSSAAVAQPASITQVFNDPTPVSRALSEGDVATLRRLQANGSNPVVQKMAKAAERRVLLTYPDHAPQQMNAYRPPSRQHIWPG